MRRDELITLRELVTEEVERRKRIKELLKMDLVKEYLEITKTSPEDLDVNNLPEIINKILETFKITKTNGIYVCTSAYYIDCSITYQDTSYYSRTVDIDSEYADYKIYHDIEDGRMVKANKENNKILIKVFEDNNIVLNPYNTNVNSNGYYEVKTDFFINAIKDGQNKSKKLLLSKYPRI